MNDQDRFDAEARRLTKQLLASASRMPARAEPAPPGARARGPALQRLAAELLLAGVLAAATVTIILALTPRAGQLPGPAGPTQPVAPSPARPSPTGSPTAISSISAALPLVLYYTGTSADGSVLLSGRTYSGRPAGTLTIPPSDSGYDIAPDGSKVLDGNQIISVRGGAVATIAWTFATLPIWADDSAHLCGATPVAAPDNLVVPTVLEFDMAGHARTVAALGAIPLSGSAWQMLACSPSADRAVVAEETGSTTSILVLRLSSGALLARHSVSDGAWGGPVAAHDGGIVAISESSGVAVRDSTTWALRARIVRWGSQGGQPLIGAAVKISWDGSRVIIDGGGAGGAIHPLWMVDWATNADVTTNTGPHAVVTGIGDAVPLTSGSLYLLPPGDPTSADPAPAYLVNKQGELQRLPQ
jgi:hypothetical protein